MEFRKLRADEVTCRVSQVKPNGVVLLLYKDARVDMNILDETVGPMNWQKEYRRDNANCVVSIWDSEKSQWISKEDTGTESRTEAEKGLASDAFKRACFCWGLGRELYTAPFIWVGSGDCTIQGNKCYDRFDVTEIGYDDSGRINRLAIENAKTHRIVYTFGKQNRKQKQDPHTPNEPQTITRKQASELTAAAKAKGETAQSIMSFLGVSRMGEITQKQYDDALEMLKTLE